MMKRIYMRAGMSPFENYNAINVITKNAIGGNAGNMLFVYSMFRALMTENTTIDVNHYKYDIKNAEEINDKYDAFVLPLANAFRPDFSEIDQITDFLKKLKIPCVVTGVGVQLPYEPDFSAGSYSFDEKSKKFCSAVLDKSASIGVRGEITVKYLEKLGFKNHIRLIGCPSMFAKGETLKVEKNTNILNYMSKINFSAQKNCPQNIWDFFENCFQMFNEYYYIAQDGYDLRLLYAGESGQTKNIDYPCTSSHYLIQENRMRFFINVPTWIDFLSKLDFSISMKIHGTVASILSGTPAFLIAHDSRTRELAEYHDIPHISYKEVNNTLTPYAIYETIDFSKMTNGHKEKFQRFVDFLTENGLESTYNENNDLGVFFDKQIQKVNYYPEIQSILHTDLTEMAKRLNVWSGHINRKIENLKKKNFEK